MQSTSSLNYTKIIATIELLEKRIAERFPDAGLRKVCQDFLAISKMSEGNIQWIAKPNIWLRTVIYSIILIAILGLIYSIVHIDFNVRQNTLIDVVTLFEAAINDLVLLGAAIFFLTTIETRIKRARAIKSLNKYRAIAHVVDMHQLTKDPNLINDHAEHDTISSPKRSLNQFELERYLDYCSEMLSLIAKVSALYSQHLPDDVVVRVANEIELLTSGISRKIWQKIIVLNELKTKLIP